MYTFFPSNDCKLNSYNSDTCLCVNWTNAIQSQSFILSSHLFLHKNIFHTKFVEMFTSYSFMKLHMFSSNAPTAATIKKSVHLSYCCFNMLSHKTAYSNSGISVAPTTFE